jgi:RND family efflux transporter MFP subunit
MTKDALLPRFIATLVAVGIAAVIGWQLWIYYTQDPWTRDGRVRADVVEVAPDVSGPVAAVFIADNQAVKAGDPLFQIDPIRFSLAMAQAAASVAKAKATLGQAVSDARRIAGLSGNAVAAQTRDQSNTTVRQAQAAYDAALADQSVDQLNLDRTTVRATVNGIISNFSMRPGDYVAAGNAVAALVDTDSIYVDGYFEETKLPRIAVGDTARITLLGGPELSGHVQSIDAGIADA